MTWDSNRTRLSAICAGLACALVLLMGWSGCGPPDGEEGENADAADVGSPSDIGDNVTEDVEDPGDTDSSEESSDERLDEIADTLRTLDDPECQRDGEGVPLGECPDGCIFSGSPNRVRDVQRECYVSHEELGGPPFCAPGEDPDDYFCATAPGCWGHEDGRIVVSGYEMCQPYPEGREEWGVECPGHASGACSELEQED